VAQNAADDNWYLHVNFWDIHTPYRVPMDYGNPFANEPVADWFTNAVIARHVKRGGPHSAQDLGMYEDSDTASHPRTPAKIRLFDKLQAAGVWDQTAVIVSADHGENQGDLGIYGEHGTADQGTCHIPMIVKWPGTEADAAAGSVDKALRYHLDWPPTCLDLLDRASGGGDSPPPGLPAAWDGQSYAPVLTGAPDPGRDELILSQCAHVCQRSVRFNQGPHHWLYLRTYHDGLHPFPKHMLFDLAADPHEHAAMATVVRDCSDVVDPMVTVLAEGGPEHARHGIDGQPVDIPAYLNRLETTGRAQAAADLRRRYGATCSQI